MEIRKYQETDSEEILQLFKETIFTINKEDYSQEQLGIWANSFRKEELNYRLENSLTFVAVTDGKIVGFGNLNEQAVIDLLYTHKDFQGQGIASKILNKLESEAKLKGFNETYTEASITAKPFFEAKGYEVERKQEKPVKETIFINFIMRKKLNGPNIKTYI